MRRIERKNHSALAGKLHKLLELFRSINVIAPSGGGGRIGLSARGCSGPLRAGGGVQLHGVAHRGGDIRLGLRRLRPTPRGVVLRACVLPAVCRVKDNAHPAFLPFSLFGVSRHSTSRAARTIHYRRF